MSFPVGSALLTKDRHWIFQLSQLILTFLIGVGLFIIFSQNDASSSTSSQSKTSNSTHSTPLLTKEAVVQKYPIKTQENVLDDPVVQTENGAVRGKQLKSREGRPYTAFYQLPYAQPPIGRFRFEPPRPLKSKWEGVRDGTVRGGKETACIQFTIFKVEGREDCLYLSVFTPELPQSGKEDPRLPVMFYILGGAYLFGRSSRYGAEYMMDENVVLVLVDFRLGAFGHLSTGDLEVRGNQAFKDQVEALRWIQKNIQKFGGDPKRVLIFGNSSGAMSVHAHLLSSMSTGLFHRAVSQSGTANLPSTYFTSPTRAALKLGKKLKCPNLTNTTELHHCFIEADANKIAASVVFDRGPITAEKVPKNGDMSQVFLAEDPLALMQKGRFNKNVPYILGCNSAEAFPQAHKILKFPVMVYGLNKFWNWVASKVLKFKDDPKSHRGAQAIRQFYFAPNGTIGMTTRYNLTNLMSDLEFVHSTFVAARLHAQHGGRVYFYWMSREPAVSYGEDLKKGFTPPYGVAHADEVQLFFPFEAFPFISVGSRDYNYSKAIIKTWTEFARTGTPNVKTWNSLAKDDWQNSKWLELNNEFVPMEPLTERMTFWDKFPFVGTSNETGR